MCTYHYCSKCGKVQEVELVKRTASAFIYRCKKCGSEIIDLGPLPL